MKKLVIALFALCAAVTAQAAFVDWQYSVSEAKSGGTDWTSGHTAYLLTASAWDSIKGGVTSEGLADAALDSSGFYLSSSTKANNIYSTGAAGSSGIRQVEAASGNYYVILATEDGYSVALDNVAVTAYTDATGANTGLTPGITIANPVSGSSISYTAFAVPEPTSGLLMLVGLGALALRRRRA